MNHNRFQRGSGTFNCQQCGKKTRDVNGQNGQLGLCELCQAKTESGNALSDYVENAWTMFDNCKTVAECEKVLKDALKDFHK